MHFQLATSLLILASTGLSSAEETKYTVGYCRDHNELQPGTGNYPIIYGEEEKRICENGGGMFCGEDSCVIQIDQVEKFQNSCKQAKSGYQPQVTSESKSLEEAKLEAFCL